MPVRQTQEELLELLEKLLLDEATALDIPQVLRLIAAIEDKLSLQIQINALLDRLFIESRTEGVESIMRALTPHTVLYYAVLAGKTWLAEQLVDHCLHTGRYNALIETDTQHYELSHRVQCGNSKLKNYTLLHHAMMHGHTNILRLLLKVVDLDDVLGMQSGDMLLHFAVTYANQQTLDILLDFLDGAKILNSMFLSRNHEGRSALDCVMESHAKDIRQLFVEYMIDSKAFGALLDHLNFGLSYSKLTSPNRATGIVIDGQPYQVTRCFAYGNNCFF